MSNLKGPIRITLILFVLALLPLCGQALADGCYMPEKAVKTIPAIPAQRALLVWKEGKETLMISSSLDSGAQRLGWIIPLPSVPETLEKASPGALKTLTFCLQPRITHDLSEAVKVVAFAVGFWLLLFAACAFGKRRLVEYALVLVVIVILAGMLMPALARARAGGVSRTAHSMVERTAKVGNYRVTVLRARSTADLGEWLSENGYASLPRSAEAIAAGYIEDGWVFAAIRLVRSEDGANTPHPIRIAFRTQEPVYPMKLTSIAGGETFLELFVLADRRAGTDLLETEFCDSYRLDTRMSREDLETKRYYHGVSWGKDIGHTDITGLMWEDCVLTKLSGSVSSSSMTDDVRFQWHAPEPHRRHLFSAKGALSAAVILLMLLGGIVLSVVMVIAGRTAPAGGERMRALVKMAEPAMLVVLIVCGTFYSALPKIPQQEARYTRSILMHYGPRWTVGDIDIIFERNREMLRRSESDMAAFVEEQLRATGRKNEILGGDMICESSPGNFTVEKAGGGVHLRIYDAIGRSLLRQYPQALDIRSWRR